MASWLSPSALSPHMACATPSLPNFSILSRPGCSIICTTRWRCWEWGSWRCTIRPSLPCASVAGCSSLEAYCFRAVCMFWPSAAFAGSALLRHSAASRVWLAGPCWPGACCDCSPEGPDMQITVNGDVVEMPDHATLTDLLRQLSLGDARIAVELKIGRAHV